MRQDDAIWADTTDGGLLRQLFGYYPTLHDAVIVEVVIDRASDTIVMVLDYNDMIGDDPTQELAARIRLEWHGVVLFEIPLEDRDLLSLDFGRRDDYIVTTLETWPGVFGTVVSETVEAILVQIDPGNHDDRPWFRYK